MLSKRVLFNGVNLADYFTIGEISRPLPGERLNTIDTPSRDGVSINGSKSESFSLSIELWVIGIKNQADKTKVLRRIRSLFNTDKPTPLWFEGDGCLYYMVIATDFQRTDFIDSLKVTVSFISPTAYIYGEKKCSLISKQGCMLIKGSSETKPVITIKNAVRSRENNLVGVRLDDGDFLYVNPQTDTPSEIIFDCESRTCSVNNVNSVPTVDSDWFEIKPGLHKFVLDQGSGKAEVSWQERWL